MNPLMKLGCAWDSKRGVTKESPATGANPVVARRYFLPPDADNSAGPERYWMAGFSFLVTVLLAGAAFGGLAMMIAGIAAELGELTN